MAYENLERMLIGIVTSRNTLLLMMQQKIKIFFCLILLFYLHVDNCWRYKYTCSLITNRAVIVKLINTFRYFFYEPTAPSGQVPPHNRYFTTKLRHATLGGTPLDE